MQHFYMHEKHERAIGWQTDDLKLKQIPNKTTVTATSTNERPRTEIRLRRVSAVHTLMMSGMSALTLNGNSMPPQVRRWQLRNDNGGNKTTGNISPKTAMSAAPGPSDLKVGYASIMHVAMIYI